MTVKNMNDHIIISEKVEVMRSVRFVCLNVCRIIAKIISQFH